jgi:hypothetical protein
VTEGASTVLYISTSVALTAPLTIRAVVPSGSSADVTVTPAFIVLPVAGTSASTATATPFFTMSALSDGVAGPIRTRVVTFTSDATSTSGLPALTVDFTVSILDAGSIDTGVTAVRVAEGSSSQVTLRRSGTTPNSAPLSYAVAFVRSSGSDLDVVTVSPSTVAITTTAVVNVTFAENAFVTSGPGAGPAGFLTFTPVGTSGSGGVLTIAPVAVTLVDNDVAALVSEDLKQGLEGGSVIIVLYLSVAVSAPVTVVATVTAGALTAPSVTVTFPPAAGPQRLPVNVTLPNDDVVGTGLTATVAFAVTNGPAAFSGLTAQSLVRLAEDDVRGVVVLGADGPAATPLTSALTLVEGGAAVRVALSLLNMTANPVVVTVGPSDLYTVSPATVTFLPSTPRDVKVLTFTAVDDSVARGARPLQAPLTVGSPSDPAWARTLPVPLLLQDNDVPGVLLQPRSATTGALPQVAEGTDATGVRLGVSVTLAAAPTAPVFVRLVAQPGFCVVAATGVARCAWWAAPRATAWPCSPPSLPSTPPTGTPGWW